MKYRPRCDEQEVREAVAAAHSASEALRLLGLRPAGGNHRSLRRWIAHFGISTDHFDLDRASRLAVANRSVPLEQVLVRASSYSRGSLKRRLYAAGLKERRCELCGQGERWHGRVMSLILDHIDGAATGNQLENLRIVCANCNATLETHCGRQGRVMRPARPLRGLGQRRAQVGALVRGGGRAS